MIKPGPRDDHAAPSEIITLAVRVMITARVGG
jgi:hypothetical protein